MSVVAERGALAIDAVGPTGQSPVRVAGISPDSTIGELVTGLVPKMGLPTADPEGRPCRTRFASSGRGVICTPRRSRVTCCGRRTASRCTPTSWRAAGA